MWGWRARIGYVSPGVTINSQERDRVLPEGMIWIYAGLGVNRLAREEFERVFESYLPAAQQVASREPDFMVLGGLPAFLTLGLERSQEIATRIEKMCGVPTILNSTALVGALNKLLARKIVVASPYAEEINEKIRVHYQNAGFEVLNIKGAGLTRNVDFGKLPDYASYRLAREAFFKAPEADAIVIECPVWPVVRNIDLLEKDFGKPVVTTITGELWAALTALHYKTPIKGYGKLLEEML